MVPGDPGRSGTGEMPVRIAAIGWVTRPLPGVCTIRSGLTRAGLRSCVCACVGVSQTARAASAASQLSYAAGGASENRQALSKAK